MKPEKAAKFAGTILQPARIGKIRYTNCIPFYHGLEESMPGLEFLEEVPARLNAAIANKQIDIAPVSSLEYLNHQKDYLILPFLGIGAQRFSGSVLLLSKKKIEDLNGAQIALSEESLSSSSLLKILLKKRYGFENTFVTEKSEPEEMLKASPAALVIGDSALFYQPQDFIYKYDLSELWWQWTFKPFCFAVWTVRKDFATNHAAELDRFFNCLLQTLLTNLMDMQKLVTSAFGLEIKDAKYIKIFNYLANLKYNLDSGMQDGLELFYRYAHELGLSPKPEPLVFFKR